jgi:hypothetical protein
MRRALLLMVPSLLAGVLGCHHLRHTAGVCDCDPEPVGANLYSYPGYTKPAIAATGARALPVGVPGALPVAPTPTPVAPHIIPSPTQATATQATSLGGAPTSTLALPEPPVSKITPK